MLQQQTSSNSNEQYDVIFIYTKKCYLAENFSQQIEGNLNYNNVATN